MPVTPPPSATCRSRASDLLRGCGCTAAHPAWVISTGAFEAAAAWLPDASLEWLMSTVTPSAFM
jgi:hypothetical protein